MKNPKFINIQNCKTKDDVVEIFKNRSLRIEISSLRNSGINLFNRDEDGGPKTMIYGDVLRGRISSACIKNAVIECMIKKMLINVDCYNTKMLPELVLQEIQKKDNGYSDEQKECIKKIVKNLLDPIRKNANEKAKKSGTDEEEGPSDAKDHMFRVCRNEISFIAMKIREYFPPEDDFKNDDSLNIYAEAKKQQKETQAQKLFEDLKESMPGVQLSLAECLLGRMSTSPIMKSIVSALNIGHAYGVNRMRRESDFFVARDAFACYQENPSAAGMMGNSDITANVMYHYINIDMFSFVENIMEFYFSKMPTQEEFECVINEAIEMVYSFIKAYFEASPSGSQTSKATSFDAFAIYAKYGIRTSNYTCDKAFVEIVKGNDEDGLLKSSAGRLAEYIAGDSCNTNEYKRQMWHLYKAVEWDIEDSGGKNLKNLERLGDRQDVEKRDSLLDIIKTIREDLYESFYDKDEI